MRNAATTWQTCLGDFCQQRPFLLKVTLQAFFREIAMRYPPHTPTPLKGSYGYPSLCGHLKLLIYCPVDLEIWMLKSGLNYGLLS